MIRIAYGLPGTGKTLLLHDLVRTARGSLFYVVDHDASWLPGSPYWRGRPPRSLRVVHGKAPEPQELAGMGAGVVVFVGVDPRQVAELACQVGDVHFVDDELDRSGRREGFDRSPLRTIANEGRHIRNAAGRYAEVHILGACRRPQKLHTDLSELCDEAYIFRIQGINTLGRLESDGMLERDELAKVSDLPNLAFKTWHSTGASSWNQISPL